MRAVSNDASGFTVMRTVNDSISVSIMEKVFHYLLFVLLVGFEVIPAFTAWRVLLLKEEFGSLKSPKSKYQLSL